MELVRGEVVIHAHLPRLDLFHVSVHIAEQVALRGCAPPCLAPMLWNGGICVHFHLI